VDWIKRRLGGDLWRLEGIHAGAIEDCIDETLMLYSTRVPRLWYEIVPHGVRTYAPKAKAVLGVVSMSFISPISTTGGYAAGYQWNNNLTGVGLVPQAGPGLLMPAGDLMRWQMARKSFMRVASLTPQYHWDPSAQLLHVYNPSISYFSFALLTLSKTFAEINANHRNWFRNHAFCIARMRLAENREKFDGAVQAPGGGAINLNSDKTMQRAIDALEKSTEDLMSFQTRVPPIWGD